jgi:hypothetical protein
MSGWIPISKTLARELPKDRPFTRLEAMFSLTLDYDQGNEVTVLGFAELWRWSRGKVERFLEEIGVKIEYPEYTGQKQNQRGQIMIQIPSRKRAENGQIKFIDSRWLSNDADRKRTDTEQKTSRSQSTTIDPNPKPYPEKKSSEEDTPPARSLFDLWNMTVGGSPLSKVRDFTSGRDKKCRGRLKERSLDEWREVFQLCISTPFLRGENDKGWRSDFDWITKNSENATKVLEGKYNDASGQVKPASSDRYSMFEGA